MKKYSLFFLFFFYSLTVSIGNTIVEVRVLTTTVLKTFIFSPLSGSYLLYGDGVLITECTPADIYQLSINGDSVRLKTFEKTIGNFAKIKMLAKSPVAAFKIKSVAPRGKVHSFNDDLEVSLSNRKNQLLLINRVNLEDYIAGVVQSEAGKGCNLEYYKLQSILCRTYLLANLNRHYLDGYGVCNDVHCQAYLNRSTEGIIVKAVQDTKGLGKQSLFL